jgi:arginine-tRNA-protein transferase
VRANQDLFIRVNDAPVMSDEKFELYDRYMREWHGKAEETIEDFEWFLYRSPVDTIEFEYRDHSSALVAVGICDVCELSLSSVYFYFDPRHAQRGLGTYGALREIAFAAERKIPYYYLGYWVNGCSSMQYKASFRPYEILCTDGEWREGGGEQGLDAPARDS